MTAATTPWLPKDALEPACFERGISTLVAEWSEAWFAKTKATCRIKLRVVAANGQVQLAWRNWGGECAVGVDEQSRVNLVEAMLDRNIAHSAVGQNDRPLLIDITNRCLDDLLGRISWLIDRDRGPEIMAGELGSGRGMSWDIGLRKAGTTISLTIGQGALVRWRKSLAPESATVALRPVTKALESQPVRVGIGLGRSVLTLADVEGLSIGDVVMLDRETGDVLPVLAADRPTPIGGRLTQNKSRPEIEIVEMKRASK